MVFAYLKWLNYASDSFFLKLRKKISLKYSSFSISIWFSGNPRVTPEVTHDVCLLARLMAANLHLSKIEALMFEVCIKLNARYCNMYSHCNILKCIRGFDSQLVLQLSMWRCSGELRVRVNELVAADKKGAKYYMGTAILISNSFLD